MLKELQEIDTADVEALAKIKAENDVVQKLIDKANESKEKVSEIIYQRVMADYDARLKALDAQARPLRIKARAEQTKLRALYGRLQKGLESAKLDLSECEFRHDIGELSDEDFDKKRTQSQEALAAAQADFDDSDKILARFVEVVPAEPDPPEPPPPPPPPVVPAPPPPARSATSATMTNAGQMMDAGATPPVDFGTIAVSREEAMALASAPPPQYGTMLMPGARLVPDLEGTEGPPFVLGALTTIGRTPDNSIALDKPEVSRRHARLTLAEDGTYTLVDNNSNNGTYVNGDRVTEYKLKEGDRIQIGTHYFFFRER
jgi:hypothetical protein